VTGDWLSADLIWLEDRAATPGSVVRLHARRCTSCARSSFPDVGSCTWCGATEQEPIALGSATAVASSAVLFPTPGAVVDTPYVVTLARFANAGLDILGRVPGKIDPEAVPPGMPLRVVSDALPDGRRHYAFVPAP
jgi:uncharacterized OB-fold protein